MAETKNSPWTKYHDFFQEYLERKGINTKTAFRCVSPKHEDKHPSMLYSDKYKKCTCLACGEKYDIFKFVGMEYGLSTFKEQLYKIQEFMKHPELIEGANKTVYSDKNIEIALSKEKKINAPEKKYPKLAYYFKDCKNRIDETDYLIRRGISKEITNKYNIGYDPGFKNGTWKAIIIPTSFYSFTARNTDENAEDRLRKVGHIETFNYWELKEDKKSPFFIVEGEIDALSFCEIGQKSISLGSISNIYGLLKKLKEDRPENPFYLCLDRDEAGQKTETILYEKMKELGLKVERTNILENYKDANEFLIKDRTKFQNRIQELIQSLENPFSKKIEEKGYSLGR
ncbi:toprim domain protein [Fusobacterium necrophorum subsp. funduliforme ATCC 51357]|uniref:toprim domain-containing protein n=2 Tax=Fusobacterium necrophorum TaxID=859 RepID=UPI00025E5C36|nr:toprim domain-containing protein [Fusobacterium necrophorum]EIJ72015.1 toprim domain protein [Fusobacterium necrophorum subsp. funduliforme ATCC 51357]KAB0553503.1 topoisomerase [Fusobacterium necrophorum subsp. funduliforme]